MRLTRDKLRTLTVLRPSRIPDLFRLTRCPHAPCVQCSHCKRSEGTEDRALWCVDVFEEAGLKPFFDLQNLEEISREQLIKDVKNSKAVVTVVDPETFRSDWVILENQTAFDNGIPSASNGFEL